MNPNRSFSLSSLIVRLQSASGWRRVDIAFALGSVMMLTMPPFNFFPLLWVCLPGLIFLLQGTQNGKQAFAVGWSFAFGFFVFGLYWIAASMFVDIKHFWWAVPFSVAGLPAFFALYYGIAAMIARKIGLSGVRGALSFGLLWFLADYARGHMFTGFPWNLLGYAFSGALPVLQITSLVGIYGLTLLTAVAACLPASLIDKTTSSRVATAFGLILFAALAIGGEIRLQTTATGDVPGVRLRLVQPDINQASKWRNSERARDFQSLIDLSAAKGDKPVTHVIWPETASTYYLGEDALHRQQIAASIPAASTVITGVIRRELDQNGATRFYNSLVAVDGLGRLVAGYDKSHLVPFGEYMPFRKFLPPALHALAASSADFTSGTGARTLRVLGLPPFSPLICYEVIFPGEVVDRNDRPDFMLNITNDGWYGRTTGPYQHFAIARVRAIEEGLPLVRVANTGISGVVDPLGRIKKRLGLDKRGFIDSDLPSALPPTLFGKYGDVPAGIAFLLISATTALVFIKKRRKLPPI
ncbi:MAG: apolipoprotein N-acyltransferase [Alphaproteobacteria bacterium]|nr:apolipoprotein N-acyltransferase [Alphaproteobacteria bacterium]